MEITLIRHTSVAVERGICYGQTDVPLAATFEQEAALTRAALASYGPFDRVYASPLQRARRLAAFCGYKQPLLDDRLKEMSMGLWEMQRFDDISDPYRDEWFADYLSLPTPGGEGFPDLYGRVASFLDELRQGPWQRVAVFAHGGVLVCAGLYAGLFPKEQAFEHQVPYGGIEHITL